MGSDFCDFLSDFWNFLKQIAKNPGSLAEWIAAIISLIAVVSVFIGYRREKRRTRVQLAEEMIEKFTSDEMILFATTTFDWGTARVPVPEKWRGVLKTSYIEWNFDDIFNATRFKLNAPTRADPKLLLYRHAFVHLFNHIERIGILWEAGSLETADLKGMAWVANQIRDWQYAKGRDNPYTKGRSLDLFAKTLATWYPDNVPQRLIDALNDSYPRKTVEGNGVEEDIDGPD